ncbi:CCR4-Not complex 3'-5'-exoribonuclease subunit Ccr4-like [Patiria miniata]|uniref:Endonuclease/exonuclease/phosphatase domain-containing protein n=1 Tax=Patiria miniata TaxID=46514 RepID=A0A913Z880_PATMI|nr:CCR4-Not complex 3'-5'-exoribonuclease subunit Ccr4-like [Patiria miniata]XP_038047931.1 CCR4-Not complex 3'-5'-exoribonuclease subunit Ccr4-like [Patiria miniata]XP_038047939.1 CCR4-Not complex 3'-5'-exoribonuclease subunit Ccr4-like [Patiria miniata]XP_038047947.1 CCR4-Not complex 3'-5'-exoribonuclease subunit Ccr4-like [Patiria miniata]
MASSPESDKFLPTQRSWVSAKSGSASDDDIADSFVVVTYNILADCHVGAETYPYLPPGYRTIEERHPRLLKELKHHGEADVICLQEVNGKYFKEVLEPALSALGYKGFHANKALGVDEGVATFYKPSRFELEGRKVVYFKDQIQEEISHMSLPIDQSEAILERTLKETVTMFSDFRCKRTGRVLKLGNVHAFWMNHIAMDVITLQIALAANMLAQFADDNKNSALILCGDFNTEPHMPAYQLLRDGRLSDQSVETLRKFDVVPKDSPNESFTLVDLMAASFQHGIQHFQSAYKTIMGVEIPFSQFHDPQGIEWKEQHQLEDNVQPETDDVTHGDDQSTRPRGKRIKALDYLWFSAETLQCDGALEMVAREVLDNLYACPNTVFPSDHLLMKAKFHLTDVVS